MQKSSTNSNKYLKFSNMKILINYQNLYQKFKEISLYIQKSITLFEYTTKFKNELSHCCNKCKNRK